MFFLNETVTWIPDMFQINHRQNCAVKTQTARGAPSTVTRSEGKAAPWTILIPKLSHFHQTALTFLTLGSTPQQQVFILVLLKHSFKNLKVSLPVKVN